MNVKVTLNHANIRKLDAAAQMALAQTADAVKTDVQQSQTMPFKTGNLQNDSTFVDTSHISKGVASVIDDTPYARRLYFHPEYNFNQTHNPNAGAAWFEPYITGTKKDYCKKVYARFLRKTVGG